MDVDVNEREKIMPGENGPQAVAPDQSLVTMTHVIYGLYAGGFIVGISVIVAIVLNYIKRDDVRGTWLESHFRWQMRTFWFGLLWG